MKKIKYTYDIVFDKNQREYIVFKINKEHFVSYGIFSSPKRKECVEYIKKIKEGTNIYE